MLRRLGPIVLGYALRFYGGELSRLVRALRRWADRHARRDRVDADLIEAYVGARFGRRHHLSSLFRYALRANAPDREHDPGTVSRSRAFDPSQPYQLGARVWVLADLHDYGTLLERIQHAPGTRPLDDSQTGERGVYLLHAAGAAATSYRIDPGIQAILSLFEAPHTCREVAALVRRATGAPDIGDAFFAGLVDAGILVAGTPAAASSAQATARHSRAAVHA